MFVSSFLYRCTPKIDTMFSLIGRNCVSFTYADWRRHCQKKLNAWHRAELRTMDRDYVIEERSYSLIRARQQALENGIKPMDPNYPDIITIYEDLPEP